MERLAPCSEKRMNAATSYLVSSVFESSVLSFFQNRNAEARSAQRTSRRKIQFVWEIVHVVRDSGSFRRLGRRL